MRPEFADGNWAQGAAGFGTEDEGVIPQTPWTSDDIWMRARFDLNKLPSGGRLYVYHDQEMEVFVNGLLAGKETDWAHEYKVVKSFSTDDPNKSLLHLGKNVIALHVHHAGDGRHFADATMIGLTFPNSK